MAKAASLWLTVIWSSRLDSDACVCRSFDRIQMCFYILAQAGENLFDSSDTLSWGIYPAWQTAYIGCSRPTFSVIFNSVQLHILYIINIHSFETNKLIKLICALISFPNRKLGIIHQLTDADSDQRKVKSLAMHSFSKETLEVEGATCDIIRHSGMRNFKLCLMGINYVWSQLVPWYNSCFAYCRCLSK